MQTSMLAPVYMNVTEEKATCIQISEIRSSIEPRNTTYDEYSDLGCSESNNITIRSDLDAFTDITPMNETEFYLVYEGLWIINKFYVNLTSEGKNRIINALFENVTHFFEKINQTTSGRSGENVHSDSSRWVYNTDLPEDACHVGWFSQACKNLGYKTTISQNINYWNRAKQPDIDDPAYADWDPVFWPTWSREYRHTYLVYQDGTDVGIGNADYNAYDYSWRAYTHFSANPPQTNEGWNDLAYASHYMADLGNPMHTGYYAFWYRNIWRFYDVMQYQYHTYYEDWALQRNDVFPVAIMAQMTIPATVQQVDDSCRALAYYTAARYDDLLFGLIDGNNAQILSITQQCVVEMMMRLNGLIYQVGPNDFYFWEDWESATTPLGQYINPNGNWWWYDDTNANSGTDTWDLTTYAPGSRTGNKIWCRGYNTDGVTAGTNSVYDNDQESHLFTKAFTRSEWGTGVRNVKIMFYVWQYMENYWDYFYLSILIFRVDGSSGTEPLSGAMWRGDGASHDWTRYVYTLDGSRYFDDINIKDFEIILCFHSDSSLTYRGVFVDQFYVGSGDADQNPSWP